MFDEKTNIYSLKMAKKRIEALFNYFNLEENGG